MRGSDGAALVIVDEQPLPPDTNETFSYDNVAHEHPRRRAAIQQLMLDFWAHRRRRESVHRDV